VCAFACSCLWVCVCECVYTEYALVCVVWPSGHVGTRVVSDRLIHWRSSDLTGTCVGQEQFGFPTTKPRRQDSVWEQHPFTRSSERRAGDCPTPVGFASLARCARKQVFPALLAPKFLFSLFSLLFCDHGRSDFSGQLWRPWPDGERPSCLLMIRHTLRRLAPSHDDHTRTRNGTRRHR
jgi:hypothetical protein